jgi:hypothetical protein
MLIGVKENGTSQKMFIPMGYLQSHIGAKIGKNDR